MPCGGTSCDLGRLDVVDSTGARSRSGTTTFRVPRTVDAFAVAVTGRGGAPVLTLTGPGGATVSTAGSGDGVLGARAFSWSDRRGGITYVTLVEPAAGSWTVSAAPGSPAIDTVRVARPLPDAGATGSVGGSGDSRSLVYRITPIEGQTVTFVERWRGGSGVLGDASGTTGTLRFAPAPGAGGRRTVVAVVSQNGLPRAEVPVTTYRTGPVRARCTPRRRCATTITLATQAQGNLLYAAGVVRPARPGGAVLLQLFRTRPGADELVVTLPTVVAEDGRFNDYLVTKGARSCRLAATYLGDATHRPATLTRQVRC